MSKPTLLITGATGFLGTELCKRLASEVNLIPHGHRSCPEGGVQADLSVKDELHRVLKETAPEVVIHTAAIREPDVCEENPDLAKKLNRDLPLQLAELLPECSRLIHISTDYVFDGTKPPYREEDAVSPLSEYGRSKAEAERGVLAHPGGAVLRIPVLVGEGPGFIQQMVDALQSGESQEVDDVLIRHPTWTRDVAEVCAWMLQTHATGIWHASSMQGATRYELTRRVGEVLQLPTGHLTPCKTMAPRKAPRPLNSKLSPEKLLQAGGPACKEIEEVVSCLFGD